MHHFSRHSIFFGALQIRFWAGGLSRSACVGTQKQTPGNSAQCYVQFVSEAEGKRE